MGFFFLVWLIVPNGALSPASRGIPRCFAMGLLGQRNAVVTAERRLNYSPRDAHRKSGVAVVSRRELRGSPHWQRAFASQHKDHRYYDLIDETIHPEFQYLYFVLRHPRGTHYGHPAIFHYRTGHLDGCASVRRARGEHCPKALAAIYVYEVDDGRMCSR